MAFQTHPIRKIGGVETVCVIWICGTHACSCVSWQGKSIIYANNPVCQSLYYFFFFFCSAFRLNPEKLMTHIFLGNRSGCKTFQFRIFNTLVQTLHTSFKSFILMKEVKWTSALQKIKSEKQKEINIYTSLETLHCRRGKKYIIHIIYM